jgi:hypothetical protein
MRPSIAANKSAPIAEIVSVHPTKGSAKLLITMEGLTIEILTWPLYFFNVLSVKDLVYV